MSNELTNSHQMELSIGGSFEFDETSGGTMHNSQESFRAAWVSEWRYLIPDYFGPGMWAAGYSPVPWS